MTFEDLMRRDNSDLIVDASKCSTVEGLKKFLNSHDILLDKNDTIKAFNYLSSQKKKKLDLDELDSVSGGKGKTIKVIEEKKEVNMNNSYNQDNWNLHK